MAEADYLPNRKWEMIGVSIVFLAVGTVFTIWRLIVRWNVSSRWSMSDWLMLLGVVLNDVDCVLNIMAGLAGVGRLQRDPFLTIDHKALLQKYIFMGQIFNIYAMFIVKVSICAYLLALNFSKGYRRLIWATLGFVVIFNFVFPSVSLWGLCHPLAARWDSRITEKKCWPITVRVAFGYMQSVSNMITDVVYATAPIVYLRQVQLSRRTQWGVRAVFIMSLACTTISALKIWNQEMHKGTREIHWDLVSMTLWATAENTVGIMVANLPPLRKSFERLFKSFLQSTSTRDVYTTDRRTGHTTDAFRMQTYRSQTRRQSMMGGLRGYNAGHRSISDDESDKAILEISDGENARPSHGIVKTTEVTVHESEKSGREDTFRKQ